MQAVSDQTAKADDVLHPQLGRVIQDQTGERFPAQVRLGADEHEKVARTPRGFGDVELVLRPGNSTLIVVNHPNLRTRIGEDEELFGLDLGARLGAPLSNQIAQGAGGDLGGVVPAREGGEKDWIAKLRS